jgi:uncharacterized protein YndB with AHSA1/START domain
MTTTTTDTRTVIMEKEMPHPPEKVWRALTETPLLDDWLLKNDFKPTVGHKFAFRSPAVANWDGVIECEVLAVEPKRRLSYTWASMGLASVVTWTLKATGGGTLVRMEQSGFRADQEYAYQGATHGWRRFFGELERVLGGLS